MVSKGKHRIIRKYFDLNGNETTICPNLCELTKVVKGNVLEEKTEGYKKKTEHLFAFSK